MIWVSVIFLGGSTGMVVLLTPYSVPDLIQRCKLPDFAERASLTIGQRLFFDTFCLLMNRASAMP
jgi:hypothetical protein